MAGSGSWHPSRGPNSTESGRMTDLESFKLTSGQRRRHSRAPGPHRPRVDILEPREGREALAARSACTAASLCFFGGQGGQARHRVRLRREPLSRSAATGRGLGGEGSRLSRPKKQHGKSARRRVKCSRRLCTWAQGQESGGQEGCLSQTPRECGGHAGAWRRPEEQPRWASQGAGRVPCTDRSQEPSLGEVARGRRGAGPSGGGSRRDPQTQGTWRGPVALRAPEPLAKPGQWDSS